MAKIRNRGDDAVVLLAGMKHCGKSSHGSGLARHWDCPYYDTDDLITEDHCALTGERLTIREFYRKLGADGFADAEERVVRQLLASIEDEGRCVIGLGGRLPANPRLQDVLASFGLFVFLKVDLRILFDRVMRRGKPPFLGDADPFGDFVKLYQEREPFYVQHADVTVELDDVPVREGRRVVLTCVEEALNAG
jgi:shikimate kinase